MNIQFRRSERQFALTKRKMEPARVGCYRTLVAFALLVVAGNAFAADIAADFNAANKLYAEGKFAAAAGAYEKILQTGVASPALWFNYGNAEFKLGQPGHAIAAYRRAELLAPRDAEVRANLEFVRNQVAGPTLRQSRWEDWLGALSLDEWTTLAMGTFWLSFILLVLRQIRPASRTQLRGLISGIILLTILSCAGLGAAATIHYSKTTAVVIEPEATARSGPFTEAQDLFKVQNGAELAVLDRRNDWLQVADGSGRIGWLPVKQVEVLPGA
ncbi:MAG TPA: SH3 domain-containing protein [Candidatus Sulfopaludibacter sp.]|nr:SH3 domain-containing protein [Candidatus Sulfopaludibacter sp.]